MKIFKNKNHQIQLLTTKPIIMLYFVIVLYTCWCNCNIINFWVWGNLSPPLCMKPYCVTVMGPCNKQDIPAACSWEMKTCALAASTVGTSGILKELVCSHFSYTLVLVNHALFPALLACVCALLSFFSIDCRYFRYSNCSEQSYVLKSHRAHSLVVCYLFQSSLQLRKLRSVF